MSNTNAVSTITNTHEIILAGFGGQGVLFAGKLIAYAGMLAEKEVSWLPSYGPEMRGGTANCHVVVSDEPVSSPIIINPTSAIIMNKPSLDKFENALVPGGIVIIDSALIDRHVVRQDVKAVEIPATQLALDMGAAKLANMVMVGKLIKETQLFTMEQLEATVSKIVPASKKQLVDINIKALELGYNY